MREEIEERIRQVIVDKLGVEPEEVTNGSYLITDLGADSLDMVEIVMEFEKMFGIEIPDETAEKIQTVGEMVDAITELKTGVKS